MCPDTRANGFTLIEVLVALVVTTFLLVIILDGAASSKMRLRNVRERQEAALLARDLLARATLSDPAIGTREGDANGLHWRLDEQALMVDPRGRFILVSLTARIESRGRSIATYSTRKLKTVALS